MSTSKDIILQNQNKGQGLVETAILAPLAIFLLIGVFEIGWLLRCYLVLTNADREAARFAIRPNYVSYDTAQPDYTPIVGHFFTSLSHQLEFTPGGTLIISRVFVDAGYSCDPAITWNASNPDYLNCDCWQAALNPYTPTIALTPLDVATYTYTWPETATVTSRLDYETIRAQMIERNRLHNCELMNRGMNRPQTDDAIYVEFIYPHYQLFGFPGWNNPLMNPITLYGHTVFRRIEGRQ